MPILLFLLALALIFVTLAIAAWNLATAVPELLLNPSNTWAWFQALVAVYLLGITVKGVK